MTTGTAVLVLDTPEMATLPASKAEQIRAVFVPMADMLQAFEADYDEIMAEPEVTPEVSARARRLRLDIAKVRVAAEKARVSMKEEYLLAGRAIDGVNNVLKWAISEKEQALEEIENHAERMEAERRAALQAERVEALSLYVGDASARALGSMDDDVWAAYLAAKKQEHTDRMEAERKAEQEKQERERVRALAVERERALAPFYDFVPGEERAVLGAMGDDDFAALVASAREAKAAHAAEQEQIRKERERLAKEAEKKEKARKAELAKIEAERQKEREAAAAERRRLESLEAIERERLAKEAAEANARADAEERAARAPVRKRLTAWVDSFALPDLPGDDHRTAADVRRKFEAFRTWARAEVGSA